MQQSSRGKFKLQFQRAVNKKHFTMWKKHPFAKSIFITIYNNVEYIWWFQWSTQCQQSAHWIAWVPFTWTVFQKHQILKHACMCIWRVDVSANNLIVVDTYDVCKQDYICLSARSIKFCIILLNDKADKAWM